MLQVSLSYQLRFLFLITQILGLNLRNADKVTAVSELFENAFRSCAPPIGYCIWHSSQKQLNFEVLQMLEVFLSSLTMVIVAYLLKA
jgi:hypothetical protein